ncbi:tyrosine phenol-lyase [Ancylomarina euxinus]|uniref:Tyrosine phenol-lyase n=1 Tax=Ancylomarina euxinus TaxID=2283627 RepID=A0A425Y101_9BACT|nr:tryptophanase [Ancylomarina euxinus]MCZ4695315.1 tryptophanase [Ancylomarina euxinus]MUP15510.1 tryptophanase [Ancylomarina euxinus]RRG21217.1 tyrosine phenol-lyase [Ancylomarina euxinus]
MELPFSESFKIKMVETIRKSTREEREEWLKKANYNLFNLKSDYVFIDLLTDSGTGAMSDKQWSELMLGDESYAGARSYYKMKEAIQNILGFDHFLPTHQGRAAENVLFSVLVKEGDIVPGNSHFDTTKGHIEFRKAKAVDCTIDEAFDTLIDHPFKGNLDLVKLEAVLSTYPKEQIPMIIVTVTCNTSGGQPVSMANMKAVKELANKYDIPVCYDSARFAENAYFIKIREEGYQDKTIKEIVAEMYSYADMATMSSKKDAIVNMGGFIAMRDEKLWKAASTYNIMFEGYVTYGGMSGRDMNALAQGLDEGTEFDTLETRIKQVEYLGEKLLSFGIPIQMPIGGHAIFVDAKKFLSHIPKEEFQAQTLGCELYLEAGIRGVEIGAILADRDPETRENRYPKLELLRLAIPRRTYTNNHMDVVAVALKNVWDRRMDIKHGLSIVDEAPIMRHFTVQLEKVE